MISGATGIPDLMAHFGQERLPARDFKNGHSNYMSYNLELDDLYLILTVYFFQERITKVDFVMQALPYDDSAGWDNFNPEEQKKKGAFMKQWMAKQRNGDAKRYDWRSMGLNDYFHISAIPVYQLHVRRGRSPSSWSIAAQGFFCRPAYL